MADVTFVIPVRAPAPYLDEALAGVAGHDAIVVLDGPGVDDPAGVRVVRTEPIGRSRARNLGVQEAETEFVAFLDADDVSLPGRVERQLAAIGDAALCFGPVRAIGEAGEELPAATAFERRRFDALLRRGAGYVGLLVDCPIYTSATLVRRDAFLAAGGYDASIDAYEDLDLYLRLARSRGLAAVDGEPVAAHRRHPANTPSEELYRGSLRVVEKHLPAASRSARRLLLERRVDALWGLGEFAAARREALRAARAEPGLLARRRFAYRLAGSLLPLSFLRSRR